jgi:hypothetical protein
MTLGPVIGLISASCAGISTGTLIQTVMRMMAGIFFSFPAGWRRQILEIVLELELVDC